MVHNIAKVAGEHSLRNPVDPSMVQSVVQANIEELGMIPDCKSMRGTVHTSAFMVVHVSTCTHARIHLALEDHKSELAMSLVRRLLAKKVGTEVEEVDAFYHPDKANIGKKRREGKREEK
eukprot:scaffold101558_cov22-Tisochrysis_lutea.AAC.2